MYIALHMTDRTRTWGSGGVYLLIAPSCCPASSALSAVPAVLAELCWPAGAEGPSGARAHFAAVLGHDAEKLAQWLFASVAGPQVSPG